ncbi:salicylate carboxymethyltransferase-like isoform X3 [Punica granatum]|uniref:Salicylate carboxymethyltransferase-like isoform X3 n=1 Tax=Punica granatum TaxID=22663 RepID=A0A6P8BZD3_PUNGR|nr:salicylate carboxymethyltransferase-like isoform X3 [Punica granatum]
MNMESVLRMNPGHEPNSYARNSTHQRNVMFKAMPIVKERVRALYRKALFPNHFAVAGLGCASGSNSLLAISWIIEAISGLCSQTGRSLPEVLVFLKDLPGNDFNSVFSSLPSFYENLKEKNRVESNCYVSAMPGSFYGRLFPSRSLHFVHSSYSVHWLSQVPELPEQNKGSIYMASTSPSSVFQAYMKQFQKDLTNLLSSRAEEIIPGGEMVLILIGRSIPDPTSEDCCLLLWWLSRSLVEMADGGLVEAADIDSFNLPVYMPYKQEVTDVVEGEGSFTINRLETFEVNWDPFYHEDEDDENCTFDKFKSGQNVADCIRSVTEPILRSHFGDGLVMENVFKRYVRLVGEHLEVEKTKGM